MFVVTLLFFINLLKNINFYMIDIEKKGICEEQTYTHFFKKHAKGLRNYLLYKFGNEEQADDITQETFIKLWQNCADVPEEKAKSYIYTLANNASLNVVAHAKVKLKYAEANAKKSYTNESPEFLAEEEEFKNKLLQAIQKLNETQRVAFLMHRIDGKKYAQIADELGISVKAVEKRIQIALQELRKEFDYFR